MPANGAECVSVVVRTGLPLELDFHSNHGHPQSAGLHLPEGACRWGLFLVTLRQYTPEFRQSAVNLVLVEGLSARTVAQITWFFQSRTVRGGQESWFV